MSTRNPGRGFHRDNNQTRSNLQISATKSNMNANTCNVWSRWGDNSPFVTNMAITYGQISTIICEAAISVFRTIATKIDVPIFNNYQQNKAITGQGQGYLNAGTYYQQQNHGVARRMQSEGQNIAGGNISAPPPTPNIQTYFANGELVNEPQNPHGVLFPVNREAIGHEYDTARVAVTQNFE
jgi:hypothetical protein